MEVQIPINPIEQELDQALGKFYKCFLSSSNFEKFLKESLPIYKEAISNYFVNHPLVYPTMKDIINNFTPMWNILRNDRKQLGLAQDLWKHVLTLIEELEEKFNQRIHKGSVYYYWGGTAILNGEIEKGYRLMHASFSEDIRTNGADRPPTPATRFVYFDYESTKQYFHDLLIKQATLLQTFLDEYTKVSGSKLDLTTFRNDFLAKHPKSESTFLFAYTIARLENLKKFEGPDNPFVGILQLNLLFDLVLVIDASIQAKTNVGWHYFDLAKELSDKAGLSLNQQNLGQIAQDNRNNSERTILEILLGKYKLADGSILSHKDKDLAISYCLRNHAAHNIASQNLTPQHYKALLHSVFNVVFLTAEELYM